MWRLSWCILVSLWGHLGGYQLSRIVLGVSPGLHLNQTVWCFIKTLLIVDANQCQLGGHLWVTSARFCIAECVSKIRGIFFYPRLRLTTRLRNMAVTVGRGKTKSQIGAQISISHLALQDGPAVQHSEAWECQERTGTIPSSIWSLPKRCPRTETMTHRRN